MITNEARAVAMLNKLLQGELCAVATYDLAIQHLKGETVTELGQNRECHDGRVDLLTQRIRELGGVPETTSGAWIACAMLVERGAALFGTDTVLTALEEGEGIGLKQYRKTLDDLDPTSRHLIETDLRAAQERSHARIRDLELIRSNLGR